MAQRLREADARDARRARRVETVDALLNLRVADDPQIDPDDPDSEERLWNELVEPDFELHLPHTPYRTVHKSNSRRTTPSTPTARAPDSLVDLRTGTEQTNGLWKNRNRSARGHLRREIAADLPSSSHTITEVPRFRSRGRSSARRRGGR